MYGWSRAAQKIVKKNWDLDSHIHVISFLHTAILKHFVSRAESQTNAPIFLPDFLKHQFLDGTASRQSAHPLGG